jgi:peptide/nickel transport system substrate-binding protein
LLSQARIQTDQRERAALYSQVQKILAEDLPYINLFFLDNLLAHSRRVRNLPLSPSGDYDFLTQAEIVR